MVTLEESLNIRFDAWTMERVTAIADDEHRTKGAVIRLLVDEALRARYAQEEK